MPLGVAIGLGVASIGVEAYNAYQSTKTQNAAMGMAQGIYGEQQGFEQQLAALLQNPSSVTSLPSYKFNLDQGSQATARQMSSSGFYGSGNEAAALTQYGQGLASSTYMQQAQLLAQLAGLAPSSATGAINSATGANANTANQTNNMLANLGIMSSLQNNPYAGGGVQGVSANDWAGAYAGLSDSTNAAMASDMSSMAIAGGV